MADWGLGDAGTPRYFCRACGIVEYVEPYGRGFPPDVALRKFNKRHKRKMDNGYVCNGEPEYRAGVAPGLRRIVEHQENAARTALAAPREPEKE